MVAASKSGRCQELPHDGRYSEHEKDAILKIRKIAAWLPSATVGQCCQTLPHNGFRAMLTVMIAQEKKRRFDAQQIGILQKREKMPKNEFDGMLRSCPELQSSVFLFVWP